MVSFQQQPATDEKKKEQGAGSGANLAPVLGNEGD
jgi:hypothetical protein